MKLLIASDIHGSMYWTKKLVDVFTSQKFDSLVLLGDLYYHGPRNPLPLDYSPMEVSETLNKLKDYLTVIKGNCDAEVDEMISDFDFYPTLSMNVNGRIVFFTHGHKFNMENQPFGKFDIMCYGHTHTNFIEEEDGKIFVNPGSISLPKNGTKNSYAIIDEEKIAIYDFDGNVICERKF